MKAYEILFPMLFVSCQEDICSHDMVIYTSHCTCLKKEINEKQVKLQK